MVTTSHPAEWDAVGLGGGESRLVKCACGFWTYRSLHPHGVRMRDGQLVDCKGKEVSSPEKPSGASMPRPEGETK